jgi:hypothetical protein
MPAINPEIFRKTFTTSPRTVSPTIRLLCRDLNRDHEPIWVPVNPSSDAIVSECFNNVAAKVKTEGGSLLFGWTIWEWSRVFIEAEHHAVWVNDGVLLDITPHVNGEDRVLFLPDPERTYDFVGKTRLTNVKRSLNEFTSVDRWIAASDALHRTVEEHSVGNELRIDRNLLKAFSERAWQAQAQILVDLARSTKVNDPCFCNSRRKFKKCCAPLIDLSQ